MLGTAWPITEDDTLTELDPLYPPGNSVWSVGGTSSLICESYIEIDHFTALIDSHCVYIHTKINIWYVSILSFDAVGIGSPATT